MANKIKIFKTLGTTLTVCGAGVVGALYAADYIEKYHTPTFDAKRMENSKKILAQTIRARETERTAAWDECVAAAMRAPETQSLIAEQKRLEKILSQPESLWDCIKAGLGMEKIRDQIDNYAEQLVNEIPRIRELDNEINNVNVEIAAMRNDSIECVNWANASKRERIKHNWNIMRTAATIPQKYYATNIH